MLVVPDLIAPDRSAAWAEVARVAVRAATIGYGLAATLLGDTLETVLASLRRPPIWASPTTNRRRLGMVLILRRAGRERGARA